MLLDAVFLVEHVEFNKKGEAKRRVLRVLLFLMSFKFKIL